MTRQLNQLQPWGIFIIRLVLGMAMLNHSIPTILHLAGMPYRIHTGSTGLSHSALGFFHWFDIFSTFTEPVGGLFLLLGLLTRFTAFLVTVDLVVSLIVFDLRHGYTASEYRLALTAIAFLLLLTGPGKAALDRKLGLT